MALQAARLGELGMIRTNLDRFCRRHYLYNSLVTSHDPNHSVYNLDAVLSLPRLFMEMLVYTEPGYVELLPAWPAEYPEGKLSGVRLYGGHTLTLSWRQGRLVSARLRRTAMIRCASLMTGKPAKCAWLRIKPIR